MNNIGTFQRLNEMPRNPSEWAKPGRVFEENTHLDLESLSLREVHMNIWRNRNDWASADVQAAWDQSILPAAALHR